ncbi:MAG: translation initiation factor IF-3, partial [Dehalococcoidales bacterium]|nr:translation initiation factor IF-3 [Dehalococcoidales bacterium]
MNHGGGNRGIVKRLRINLQIRAGKVRLIGEEGEQLGEVPSSQALQIAREHELDLVEVAPTANPPVCKILDYGKYKYEQAKKERKAKKGQKVGLLREVRLRPKIEDHDLQGKIKITRKLLGEGSKVKVRVRFRGRERIYPEMGVKVLQKLTESLKDIAMVSNWSTGEVRNMFAVLAP